MRKNNNGRRNELTPHAYSEKVTEWFRTGKKRAASYLIVAFDFKKSSPFPVYVGRDTDVQQKIKSFNDNEYVQAVEVYDINKDLQTQLTQARTWNV